MIKNFIKRSTLIFLFPLILSAYDQKDDHLVNSIDTEQNIFDFTLFINKNKAFVEQMYGKPFKCQKLKEKANNAVETCNYHNAYFAFDQQSNIKALILEQVIIGFSVPFKEDSLIKLRINNIGKDHLGEKIAKKYKDVYDHIKPVHQNKLYAGMSDLYDANIVWNNPAEGVKKITLNSTISGGIASPVTYMQIEYK